MGTSDWLSYGIVALAMVGVMSLLLMAAAQNQAPAKKGSGGRSEAGR